MPNLVIKKSVDEDLKVVTSYDENTSLSLAKEGNGARVDGNLIVTDDLQVKGSIKGNLAPGYDIPGTILGYTDIGLNEGRATYNLTTSYVVPTDEFSVSFIVPSSGKVEIMVQITFNAGANGLGDLYAGLSTANATDGYSALLSYHEEELLDQTGRSSREEHQHYWTVTGLTAGDTLEYWAGFKSSATLGTPQLEWGGSSSGHNPSFIMKATALPATITT